MRFSSASARRKVGPVHVGLPCRLALVMLACYALGIGRVEDHPDSQSFTDIESAMGEAFLGLAQAKAAAPLCAADDEGETPVSHAQGVAVVPLHAALIFSGGFSPQGFKWRHQSLNHQFDLTATPLPRSKSNAFGPTSASAIQPSAGSGLGQGIETATETTAFGEQTASLRLFAHTALPSPANWGKSPGASWSCTVVTTQHVAIPHTSRSEHTARTYRTWSPKEEAALARASVPETADSQKRMFCECAECGLSKANGTRRSQQNLIAQGPRPTRTATLGGHTCSLTDRGSSDTRGAAFMVSPKERGVAPGLSYLPWLAASSPITVSACPRGLKGQTEHETQHDQTPTRRRTAGSSGPDRNDDRGGRQLAKLQSSPGEETSRGKPRGLSPWSSCEVTWYDGYKLTASGERYDRSSQTTAVMYRKGSRRPFLPFGTVVEFRRKGDHDPRNWHRAKVNNTGSHKAKGAAYWFDHTPAVFRKFAPLSRGRLILEWRIVS